MKISNRTKDKLVVTGIAIVILWLLISFVVAVVNIFAENNSIVSEYKSRQVIIRAETDEDRFYNDMWRSQYYEQYGVEWEE